MNYLKRFFPISLAVWPYLFFLILFIKNEEFYPAFLYGYLFLTAAVYITNIIYAFTCKDDNAFRRLAFWDMLIKLVHIPFYLLVFLTGLLLLFSIVVPALIFLSPLMIFLLFLIDLFLMLTSSVYGISALLRGCRKKLLSKKFTAVNIVLHLFFAADLISSIVVYAKLKKASRPVTADKTASAAS